MLTTLLALALQAAAPPAAAPNYAQDAAWLCRPGRNDACAVNQDVTVVAADGSRRVVPFRPAAKPNFDCFYVYPTVSADPGGNSDMTIGQEEREVAAAQAARFTAQCRVFAPLYRQVTLTALRKALVDGQMSGDRALAYADVKAAWDDYLARDNGGRGVLLIGHSQGSGILKQLIAREIDGKPMQQRLIAAYLAGTNVVDGDLPTIKPCTSAADTSCVVSWVTFRAGQTPPADSRFGRVDGKPAWCVDPAMLNGAGASSHAILGARGAGLSSAPAGPWTRDGAAITTAFVEVPGLISTRCVTDGGFGRLAVTVNGVPADPRTDTIVGDVTFMGNARPEWGLHLIDIPVVMGDLIDLSGKQAAAWAKRR